MTSKHDIIIAIQLMGIFYWWKVVACECLENNKHEIFKPPSTFQHFLVYDKKKNMNVLILVMIFNSFIQQMIRKSKYKSAFFISLLGVL